MNKCELVRTSCEKVMQQAEHVKINEENLKKFAEQLAEEFKNGKKYTEFDEYDCHFSDKSQGDLLLTYNFILDSLNFCFWPAGAQGWEYDNLALAVKNCLLKDNTVFNPENLVNITYDFVKNDIFNGMDFPLLNERVRVLREVGAVVLSEFDGKFSNILKKADKSAVRLLYLLTSFFNNFQDTAIYKGEQTCFYKRSQILIGDIYSSFKGKNYGEFTDIDQVTMFPDYRVPQILNEYKIMEYSQDLTEKISELAELPHGSNYEIEIRAATVVTCEKLKHLLIAMGHEIKTIEIDWILWQKGELLKDEIVPHHRVLSIFY